MNGCKACQYNIVNVGYTLIYKNIWQLIKIHLCTYSISGDKYLNQYIKMTEGIIQDKKHQNPESRMFMTAMCYGLKVFCKGGTHEPYKAVP